MILKILFFPFKFFIYSIIILSLSQMIQIKGKTLNSHYTSIFNSIKKWAYHQNIIPNDKITIQFSSSKNKIKETVSSKDKKELNKIIQKNY